MANSKKTYTSAAMDDPNEYCWETGDYLDTCNCSICFHKEECSGSDLDED